MRLLVTQAIDPVVWDAITQYEGVFAERWLQPGAMPRELLLEKLAPADALLSTLRDRIDDDLLAGAPRLKIVSNIAVGYDNFDLDALKRHRVLATNTPDVLTDATADLTMGLLIVLLRQMWPSSAAIYQGRWQGWSPTAFLGTDLVGKTLGIVGMGRIGQAVGRRAQGFGMRILGLRPRHHQPSPLPGVDWVTREELLPLADVISLHLPGGNETYHWCDENFFAALKPGAFLINAARGSVVDSAAMLKALHSGRLAGAALDVYEEEPLPPDHPFLREPNLVLMPHIGSATVQTRQRMAERAWSNIVQWMTGQAPTDLINPEVWPQRRNES